MGVKVRWYWQNSWAESEWPGGGRPACGVLREGLTFLLSSGTYDRCGFFLWGDLGWSLLTPSVFRIALASLPLSPCTLKLTWLSDRCSGLLAGATGYCGLSPQVHTELQPVWTMTIPQMYPFLSSVQFSSVTQSCLTLYDPMDCSTPGFPVCQQLPECPLSR